MTSRSTSQLHGHGYPCSGTLIAVRKPLITTAESSLSLGAGDHAGRMGLVLAALWLIACVTSPAAATSSPQNVSPQTAARLCHAQCVAVCLDNGIHNCPCPWSCEQDVVTETSEVPSVRSVTYSSLGPSQMNITWQLDSPYSVGHVVYVAETRLANESTWKFWAETNRTHHTLVGLRCEDMELRVLAVSQWGWANFQNTTIPKRVTARDVPGVPMNVRPAYDQYYDGTRFYSGFIWDLPQGWAANDIVSYYVPAQTSKNCSNHPIPPLPMVSKEMFLNGSGKADFSVHNSAYLCSYTTVVQAISVCAVYGQPQPLLLDYTDCNAIAGFACPIEPLRPPGSVAVASVSTAPGRLNVTISWQPPADLGYKNSVDYYVILVGAVIQDFPVLEIERDGSSKLAVPGNITTKNVIVWDYYVEYGIKVLAQALDPEGVPLIPDDYIHMKRVLTTFEVEQGQGNDTTDSTTRMLLPNTDDNALGVVIGSVVACIVITVVTSVVIGVCCRLREAHRRASWTSGSNLSRQFQTNVKQNLDKRGQYIRPDSWEIPASALLLQDVLGQGAFGQVVRAKLDMSVLGSQRNSTYGTARTPDCLEMVVAVKLLLDCSDETQRADFLREMELMKTLGRHNNVVGMIACCTQGEPLCLVVEHMAHGDLLHYLRRHRHLIQESEDHCQDEERLTTLDLISFARQIAVGMEFLSQKGFVHRDLATRNILVGERKSVKIGDFGLARYIYDDQIYVTKRGGRLPLKWMAPEAIFDLTFTSASDVWSFGVVTFELMTLGGVPYPAISNKDLLQELQNGYRMPKPDNCTDELYELMMSCWKCVPLDRLTFSDLRSELEKMLEEHSAANYLTIQVDDSRDYYRAHTSSSASSSFDEFMDSSMRGRSQSHTLQRTTGLRGVVLSPATLTGETNSDTNSLVLNGGKYHAVNGTLRPAVVKRSRSAAGDFLRASISSQDPLLVSSGSLDEESLFIPETLNETVL